MISRLARLLAIAAVAMAGTGPARAAPPAPSCRSPLAGPVGTSSCPGVRPGAMYFADNGNGCSMSFVFHGSDRHEYVASAGHCIWADSNLGSPADKEAKWKPGAGMPVSDPSGQRIGRFAYGIWTDERDFSLIRLDSGVQASAAMCYFGGPVSMYTAHSSGIVFLKHFGNGLIYGDTIPARTALARNTLDAHYVYAYAAALPGDSGSAVMTEDGQAIGTLVDLDGDGTVAMTRLDTSVAEAERYMHVRLSLQRAAMSPDLIHL